MLTSLPATIRGSSMAERKSHNLEVEGSKPSIRIFDNTFMLISIIFLNCAIDNIDICKFWSSNNVILVGPNKYFINKKSPVNRAL